MLTLFGLSTIKWGSLIWSPSKIVSLVSFVAVAVRAMIGAWDTRDLISWRLSNHSLKAACLFDLDFPLQKKVTYQWKTFNVTISICMPYQLSFFMYCVVYSHILSYTTYMYKVKNASTEDLEQAILKFSMKIPLKSMNVFSHKRLICSSYPSYILHSIPAGILQWYCSEETLSCWKGWVKMCSRAGVTWLFISHTCHSVFLSIPQNCEVQSHPVNAWKTARARDLDSPRVEQILLMLVSEKWRPMPNATRTLACWL